MNPAVLGKWGPNGTRVARSDAKWKEIYQAGVVAGRTPGNRERVFCASFADVFEEWDGDVVDAQGFALGVDEGGRIFRPREKSDAKVVRYATLDDVRMQLFTYIQATEQSLDWLLLSKRPENIRPILQRCSRINSGGMWQHDTRCWLKYWLAAFPDTVPIPKSGAEPPNVWLGVSVESQEAADARIPILAEIPAAVRFLSCEPLLEQIDIGHHLGRHGIDWVIVGGESGPRARRFDLDWARSIRSQCDAAGTSCFVKQLGAFPVDSAIDEPHAGFTNLCLKDKKGGEISEFPADLQIREFPKARG